MPPRYAGRETTNMGPLSSWMPPSLILTKDSSENAIDRAFADHFAAAGNVPACVALSSRPTKTATGKQRWRYRRNGITVALPGQPDEDLLQRPLILAASGGPSGTRRDCPPSETKPCPAP